MGRGRGRDLAKAILDRNVASLLRYTHTYETLYNHTVYRSWSRKKHECLLGWDR